MEDWFGKIASGHGGHACPSCEEVSERARPGDWGIQFHALQTTQKGFKCVSVVGLVGGAVNLKYTKRRENPQESCNLQTCDGKRQLKKQEQTKVGGLVGLHSSKDIMLGRERELPN